MKLVYEDTINEHVYIKIFQCDNDIYIVDTSGDKCTGLIQKIDSNKTRIRLDDWYDKTTKRHKGKSNKLFNHTERWFLYMVEKYYFNNIGKPSKVETQK